MVETGVEVNEGRLSIYSEFPLSIYNGLTKVKDQFESRLTLRLDRMINSTGVTTFSGKG